MKPGNGRSEDCGRKAKRRGDTLHTAHDAPHEMPDRSRAEPLHLRAAGTQAGAARARDDRPCRFSSRGNVHCDINTSATPATNSRTQERASAWKIGRGSIAATVRTG